MSSQPPYGNDPSLYPSGGQSYPPQPPYQQPGYPEPSYPPQPSYPQQNYPQQPYPQPNYPTNPGAQGGYMPPPPPPPPYGAPPAYGVPAYGGYAQPSVPMMAPGMPMQVMISRPPGNGLAVSSLVLGIVGAVFALIGYIPPLALCLWSLAFILGIIGTVLGAVGLRNPVRKGMAISGLVLSIIAFIVPIGVFLLVILIGVSAAAAAQ